MIAQDRVQTGSEYLQAWRLHDLPGQPVPARGHPHSENVFPDIQMEPPVFQFVPTAPGPVTGHHCKEPSSILFAPSLQVLICIDKIPPEPSLLQAEQSELSIPVVDLVYPRLQTQCFRCNKLSMIVRWKHNFLCKKRHLTYVLE